MYVEIIVDTFVTNITNMSLMSRKCAFVSTVTAKILADMCYNKVFYASSNSG